MKKNNIGKFALSLPNNAALNTIVVMSLRLAFSHNEIYFPLEFSRFQLFLRKHKESDRTLRSQKKLNYLLQSDNCDK